MQVAEQSPGADKTARAERPPGRDVARTDRSDRLEFLDALRAIGALCVVVQHGGEQLFPAFKQFTTYNFQVGQFGVLVFFLCSGFIIPRSLERYNSLGLFWITRFFRLYPLYWLSLGVAALCGATGLFALPAAFDTRPLLSWGASLTMFQKLINVPYALGQYWSLFYEMVFYGLVSLLFALGWHKKTVPVTVGLLGLSIVAGLVVPLALRVETPLGFLFSLPTMYTGTVIYRYMNRQTTGRTAARVVALALAAAVIIITAGFYGRDNPALNGTQSFWPMLTAWLGAYAVFGLAFVARFRSFPAALTYTGKISYSIYLLHPVPIAALSLKLPGVVLLPVWLTGVIALSALTYHAVEKPFINLGGRINRGWRFKAQRRAGALQVESGTSQESR